MFSSLKLGVCASALLLAAGTAQASTVVFSQADMGENVVADPARAMTNSLSVDVNQDGFSDLRFQIRNSIFSGDIASVEGVRLPTPELGGFRPVLEGDNTDGPNVALPVDLSDGSNDLFINPGDFEGPGVFEPVNNIAPFQEVLISQRLFAVGEAINADTFGEGNRRNFLFGASPASSNFLPDVDDSGIFGIRIRTGEAAFFEGDGVFTTGFLEGSDIETFFGFIEVTHGSIIIGNVGFNNDPLSSITAGAPLTVAAPAPVPLPASALLLVGALAGLGTMRRRKKSA